MEIRFKDRFDHQLRRHLHHSIPHRRYPQRPLLPICLRYVSPLHRGRTISPARSAASISARNSPTPRCSIAWIVSPSIPAAPPLLRTRLPASHRTSLLWIRSYSAWNRRILLCLAHTYSLRWSCRTFSLGVLAVSSMPSHLPPHKHDQSRAPSLQRVVLHAFFGTIDPSDSLLAPRVFRHPALYARSLPDLAAR